MTPRRLAALAALLLPLGAGLHATIPHEGLHAAIAQGLPTLALTPSTQGRVSCATRLSHTYDAPHQQATMDCADVPRSLWPNDPTPSIGAYPNTAPIELGTKFQASVAGYVTGVRVYQGTGNTDIQSVSLWASNGTLLATEPVPSGADGWRTINFSNPMAIAANTDYIASYFTRGHLPVEVNYFSGNVTSGPLTAPASGNGVYQASATSTFPAQGGLGHNYWADVVFQGAAFAPATPTPGPPPTLLPTSVPPSTPVGAMLEGVPVCTDHEAARWHPLVKRDGSNNLLCTYGHEHHSDPNTVNDLFGAPGAWWGGHQELSYPWQTFAFTATGAVLESPPPPTDPSSYENARKHNGYKWYVKRDLPCSFAAGGDNCFRAFRIQVHSLGAQTDTMVRFHSFSAEALVEHYTGGYGIIRGGGWMDTGHLGLHVDGGTATVCPGIDTDPPPATFNCPRANTQGQFRESYSTADVPSPYTAHANPGGTTNWYAGHFNNVLVQPAVQMWGPTSYVTPAQQLYYAASYRANNTTGHLENIRMGIGALWQQPPALDGTRTGTLYENRHGQVAPTCTTVGLDCIPHVVETVKDETAFWHAPTLAGAIGAPYVYWPSWDVLSPTTGNSLVQFPN